MGHGRPDDPTGHGWSRLDGGTGSPRRLVVGTAWAFVLVGTNVPRIVASEVFATDPGWIVYAQAAAIGGLLLLTVVDERFLPLQGLAMALLAVKVIEVVPVADLLGALGASIPPEASGFASILFRGLVALALLGVLFARGDDRASLFLLPSDLSATAARERIPLPSSERPWSRHGPLIGGVVIAVTALFLLAGGANFAFWEVSPRDLLGIAAVVAAGAAVNAFTEEFLFRAVPLSDLADAVGKNHAMVLLGALFGLSHYYGTPGGPVGVLMTFFLGWWLTKSLLETRGMTVAWTVHFSLDVVIFSAFLLP